MALVKSQPISIAISTKDRRQDLYALLDSIRRMEYPQDQLEIVVVEESDHPDPIPGVKYIHLPRLNMGFGFTRNLAIAHCSHALIAFVDDDCLVTTQWLNNLLSSLTDAAAAVTGGVKVKDCNSIGYCENILGFPAGGLKSIQQSGNVIRTVNEIVTCNALVRKNLMVKVDCYESSPYTKFGGEDSILSYRLKALGFQLIYDPTAVVYHKPRETLKGIFYWALRMGKSWVLYRRYLNHKRIWLRCLRLSVLVKLMVLLIGLIPFHAYAHLYFPILFALYWLRTGYQHRFYRRYIENHYNIFLILPFVKFLFDLGLDCGRWRALLFKPQKIE